MRITAAVIFSVCLFVSGCVFEDEKKDDGVVFPLKVGNAWEYTREFRYYNFRSDPLKPDTTITHQATLTVARTQKILDTIDTYVVSEFTTEEQWAYNSDSYYLTSKDGLSFVAYRGAGVLSFKPSFTSQYPFGPKLNLLGMPGYIEDIDHSAKSLTDSLTYEEEWPLCFKYPLEVGSEWAYREDYIFKLVEGIEQVTVPAGTFECYKIRWHYGSLSDDFIWYDYICSKGLIKRYFKIEEVRTTISGTVDIVDFEDVAVLTSYHLR